MPNSKAGLHCCPLLSPPASHSAEDDVGDPEVLAAAAVAVLLPLFAVYRLWQ